MSFLYGFDSYSDLESDSESDAESYYVVSDPESPEPVRDPDPNETKLDQDLKAKIFSTVKQLKTPSAFAYSTVDSLLPNPVLYLPPHGTLGLPLTTDDAQKIISQARQSPFGKGEKTLIDTTFRKSWELNPNQFLLKNPEWNRAMETVVDTVTTGLGLGKGTGKVSAELYKLLLYEPGAFFKPHKDSEKVPGMFATLVVCLPSQHEGGKLVLTHDNEKYEFETAKSSSYGSSYAAWYADITHEVLPVVSGYRLMLTYNLVRQADYKIPSCDLARGHLKELSTMLEQYNSLLGEGDDKLPPILVHKLEHKYTKVSLKLNALKPPDLAQVQTLAHVSRKLGFDIYLATLELMVNKDDEDPTYLNSQFREQKLNNMVELDGKLIVDSLDYPDGALIDPAGQAEDDADEEEHEGPTGNEGSPATYWYRDAVVVLVPPSKQLNFVFKFEFDGLVIEPLFCKLMREFTEDPAQKPKLVQLCGLALQQELTDTQLYDQKFNKFSDPIPPFFQQAVATAIDLDRIDLFEEAYRLRCDKIMLNDAPMLGRRAADNGVAAMRDRLMKGVWIASSVANKVEFLKAVAEGFETAVPVPSSAERASLKQWSREAIFTATAELKTLTKADGVSLAQLCKTMDWSRFESKTEPIVLKAVVMAKISFVNELMSTLQQELDEKQQSFIEMIIRSIWNEFVFEAKRPKSKPKKIPYWLQSKINPEDLNKNDILHIVENTVTILSFECVETTIIPALFTAIPVASKECSKELFISLAQMILKNELVGFRLSTSDAVPPPSNKRLVQALLTKFLSENGTLEPQAPNWSQPPRTCKRANCEDCSVVNRFLQDPNKKSFKLPCSKSRRQHLTHKFMYTSISSYTISYTDDFEREKSFIWEITKHRRDYDRAKSEWMRNNDSVLETLSVLKNDIQVNNKLEAYLRPYCSIIMNAKIKELPDLKSLVTMPRSSETNKNSASAHNQLTNQAGHKREAGHIVLPKDKLAKRTRS